MTLSLGTSTSIQKLLTNLEILENSLLVSLISAGPASVSQPVESLGKKFTTQLKVVIWKTTPAGIIRAGKAGRLFQAANSLRFRVTCHLTSQYLRATIFGPTLSLGHSMKIYVVQTNPKIVERCMPSTTDPGTWSSTPPAAPGTTAYVAEKWGRRWITCDTSRVAVTLAKARLMTASYDYFELRYPHEGLKGGFIYKTVPHVTLRTLPTTPRLTRSTSACTRPLLRRWCSSMPR